MAQILIPDTNIFSPTKEDFTEAARYLGYRKISAPDEMIQKLIEECCHELFNILSPQAVIESFDLSLSQNNQICFGDVILNSVDLSRNLNGCSKVYIFAATIGPKVDACIRKSTAIDTVKAWNELLEASETAAESGLATWADIYIPGFGSYFVKFEPGEIPMPDLEVNSKLDIQISNVVNEYMGLGEEIEPTVSSS